MNRPTNSQLLVLVAGKLGYVIFRFVIPWVFMPWHRLVRRWGWGENNSRCSTLLLSPFFRGGPGGGGGGGGGAGGAGAGGGGGGEVEGWGGGGGGGVGGRGGGGGGVR